MGITETILASVGGLIATVLTIVVMMMLSLGRNLVRSVDRLDNKVNRLDSKVDRLDNKVDRLDNKVDRLDSKVDRLDSKVDDNGIGHDREIKKVSEQVTDFTARVARVEGYNRSRVRLRRQLRTGRPHQSPVTDHRRLLQLGPGKIVRTVRGWSTRTVTAVIDPSPQHPQLR